MNDFEQSLIASAKTDRMSPDKKRALAAAFAGAATLTVAGTATATAKAATSAAAAKKGATLAIVKWLAVGVTGTALVAGGGKVVYDRAEAEHALRAPTVSTSPAPPPVAAKKTAPTLAVPTDVAMATASPPAEAPPPVVPAPRVVKPTTARPIADELHVIDRARVALASNDVAAADSALAEHAREFPNGAFADEARVLRIDATAKKGDRTRAAAAAKAYLAAHPDSPYAERLRAYAEAAR